MSFSGMAYVLARLRMSGSRRVPEILRPIEFTAAAMMKNGTHEITPVYQGNHAL
jgi:hypothetical protein